MPRVIFVLIALGGAYFADRAAFDGRYYRQIASAADNAANQFNYKVRDLLRPLGR